MKPTIFLIVFLIFFIGCDTSDDGFRISGKIKGLDFGEMLLQRRVEGKFVTIDSCISRHGNFEFEGKMERPEMCYIHIADSLPYLRFFNENSEIIISARIDSLQQPLVTGSASQDLLSNYNRLMGPYEAQLDETYSGLYLASREQDSVMMKLYEAEFDSIAEEQKSVSLKFIKENNSSVVSAYLVWGTLAYDLDLQELTELASLFPAAIQESVYVRQINDHIETLKKVAVGQPCTEVALPGPDGKILRLSQMKGNLVLIDFWASWCGPCRRENPYMVALYNEFRDRDFEILGVSLDQDRTDWINAIREDSLYWHQVSDLKGWNSAAVKLYGVRAIPHTVLIDREGIIIGTNLDPDSLREKIMELTRI